MSLSLSFSYQMKKRGRAFVSKSRRWTQGVRQRHTTKESTEVESSRSYITVVPKHDPGLREHMHVVMTASICGQQYQAQSNRTTDYSDIWPLEAPAWFVCTSSVMRFHLTCVSIFSLDVEEKVDELEVMSLLPSGEVEAAPI